VIDDQFHDYPMLGGRTMTDQKEQSLEETKRKEKRIEEETEGLAKEQVRKKAYLAREQAIEEDQKAKKPSERKSELLRKLGNQLKTTQEGKLI
jgi:hypothetical protein